MSVWRDLDELKLWARNYNRGDTQQIKKSILRFGFNNALRVWRESTVMAGNHSTIALRECLADGWTATEDGIKLASGKLLRGGAVRVENGRVQVDTVDLAHLPKSEAEAFAIADNHIASKAEPDDLILSDLLLELKEYDLEILEDIGFDALEFDELIDRADLAGSDDRPTGDAGALLNRAEELKEKFEVERGQLWIIGRHHLLCGDSYSEADIQRLLDGVKPDMLHTDPPYGISIVQPRNNESAAAIGGAKPFGSTASTERKGKAAVAERDSGLKNGKVGGGTGALVRQSRRAERVHVQHGEPSRNQIIQSNLYPVIEGDDRPFDPSPFIDFAPVVILWGANYYADKLPIKACWITWDKREGITRNNFADCELAWTNLDKPARVFHHLWNGLHKGSQHGQRRIHPTEKPVALFEEIGRMFCPKGIWVDLFAGSGAQIEAAERIGATCYALEYEPLYVACILQRMTDLGLTPHRAE